MAHPVSLSLPPSLSTLDAIAAALGFTRTGLVIGAAIYAPIDGRDPPKVAVVDLTSIDPMDICFAFVDADENQGDVLDAMRAQGVVV